MQLQLNIFTYPVLRFLNFQETRDFIFLQIFRRNTLTFFVPDSNKQRGKNIFSKNFPLNQRFWVCISAPFVQISRGANVKCLWIFRKTPPEMPLSVQTSERNFKNLSKNIPILGIQINAFCAMSERSFYYGEIIKTSKTRMGVFHKSRNRQTNIQQPLSQMQKQMQAKLQSGCCCLSELSIQKRCENKT